jgi:glycosyltransferase involved in cell wall biosynthesis
VFLSKIKVGFFSGPWSTSFVAQDGALLAFEDMEQAIVRYGNMPRISLEPVSTMRILDEDFSDYLANLDVLFCNCGPLTSLVLGIRAAKGIKLPLIREVHTLGWVGTFFQEFVADELSQNHDLVIHASVYSASIWKQISPQHQQMVYQPISQAAFFSEPEQTRQKTPLRACFLSRLSQDKGFHELPRIIQQLKEKGWDISKIDVAGKEVDVSINHINQQLRRIGVQLIFHNQLSRLDALNLMKKSDLVFFPSTSSFESLGRVVVEAALFKKKVFAADYCGAYDLFHHKYRIPLKEASVSGKSYGAFSITELDFSRWNPPEYEQSVSILQDNNVLLPYKYDSETFSKILEWTQSSLPNLDISKPVNVMLEVDYDNYKYRSAEAWAFEVYDELLKLNPSRQDLNDLGGVFKYCLKKTGFDPNVKFSTVNI